MLEERVTRAANGARPVDNRRRTAARALPVIVLIAVLLPARVVGAQEPPEPWWRDRVFYEIFVRSFADSDGDGIGDFQGLIDRLDYLNDGDPATTDDLGITGIWLMPVAESDTYHGYHVTDYRQIETDYGTNGDFLRFMDAARERGIAVIVDLVTNHTAAAHPWFVEAKNPRSAYADWYLFADEHPGYLNPWGDDPWHRLGDRYYYGIFDRAAPDLNYENPDVTEVMRDVARFWLDDMGVDGFRLDAIKHLIEDGAEQENTAATHAWLGEFNAYLDSIAPDALTVGELFGEPPRVMAEYAPDEVDIAFHFDLARAMIGAARSGGGRNLALIVGSALDVFPDAGYATFLTNHDQNRAMTELGGDVGAAKMAASLLLTLPGVPFLYYGEEIGMTGAKPDERIRTPMQWNAAEDQAGFTTGTPWQPLQPDYAAANVAVQTGVPDSLLSHYRALIQFRNRHPALQSGRYVPVDSEHRSVYAFLREDRAETLLVLLNLSAEPVTDYALAVDSFSRAEPIFGDATDMEAVIDAEGWKPLDTLPPRSTFIFALD